jgi:hypothetical protein
MIPALPGERPRNRPRPLKLERTLTINAPPDRVLNAFFDVNALRTWWGVVNAVAMPRTLGPYALEWPTSELRDEVLGPLGGVFRGIVMQFESGAGFFVADLFWLPPEGDPIGPMGLDVAVSPSPTSRLDIAVTELRLTQSGFEENARWRRYYEVIGLGWDRALASLKRLMET